MAMPASNPAPHRGSNRANIQTFTHKLDRARGDNAEQDREVDRQHEDVAVFRRTRNGAITPGILATSEVVEIHLVARNSIYRMVASSSDTRRSQCE
jgi:hypothetical protein